MYPVIRKGKRKLLFGKKAVLEGNKRYVHVQNERCMKTVSSLKELISYIRYLGWISFNSF